MRVLAELIAVLPRSVGVDEFVGFNLLADAIDGFVGWTAGIGLTVLLFKVSVELRHKNTS